MRHKIQFIKRIKKKENITKTYVLKKKRTILYKKEIQEKKKKEENRKIHL